MNNDSKSNDLLFHLEKILALPQPLLLRLVRLQRLFALVVNELSEMPKAHSHLTIDSGLDDAPLSSTALPSAFEHFSLLFNVLSSPVHPIILKLPLINRPIRQLQHSLPALLVMFPFALVSHLSAPMV